MSDMKSLLKKRPYRLPTVLGLIFLLVSLVAGIFLVRNNQIFFLKASPDIVPREVKITNITDTSFTVSWITAKEVSGFIKIKKEGEERVFADDRDQLSGQIGKFTTHYVTVKNLSPSQKYLFWIGSGGKIFDSEGKPFEAATGSTISQPPPSADPAYGQVETADGQPAEGAIVYLGLPNVTSQSTLVKASGNWLITLSLARSSDLSDYGFYDQQTSTEEIFVQGGSLGTATAVFTTKADSPAPTLILGKGLDITNQPTFAQSATPTLQPTSPASGFQVEPTFSPTIIPQPQIELKVSYPAEGELVSTSRPEFFGKGPEKSVITIIVNSQGFFGEAVTDEQGNWSWSPPEDLEPGKHKLLVRYQDENGQVKTTEHNFTVLAADESDLPSFTSTPSATPSPTPAPTLPPRVTRPSTEPGVPKPGVLTPTFLVSIMGIGAFVVGVFLKRKFSLISNF